MLVCDSFAHILSEGLAAVLLQDVGYGRPPFESPETLLELPSRQEVADPSLEVATLDSKMTISQAKPS